MKPDNWIDGLIWKDKLGKFWKITYDDTMTIGNKCYYFKKERIDLKGALWWDADIEGFELTNLTEEEARLIEML